MLSNQILQNIVDGLSSITQKNIIVVERDGRMIAGDLTTESGFNRA